MSMRTYSPDEIILIAFGQRITGFADGTFVKVARATERVTKHVGADGKVTRVISLNKSGTVTFTLAASSPSNDVFSAAMVQDGLTRNAAKPFLLEDLAGTTECHAPNAWVEKEPEGEFSKDLADREWVLGVDELETFWGQTTIR